MLATEPGMVTELNSLSKNARYPILASPVPRVTELNWFLSNTLPPMLVTELGIVTEVNHLFSKAKFSILVVGYPPIVAGMTTVLPHSG